VYPTCLTHTATGRVSLAEPSLQNIPKDFDVELTDDLKARALGKIIKIFRQNLRFSPYKLYVPLRNMEAILWIVSTESTEPVDADPSRKAKMAPQKFLYLQISNIML
jgi:hypothetical protein